MRHTKVIYGVIAVAAAMAAAVLVAPPPASADWRTVASRCRSNIELLRCITLTKNNGNLIGDAQINDKDGRPDYHVAVTRIRLQWYDRSQGKWLTIHADGDFDGWHYEWDYGNTPWSYGCRGTWRAIAKFKWKLVSTGDIDSRWIASGTHTC